MTIAGGHLLMRQFSLRHVLQSFSQISSIVVAGMKLF